MAKIKITSEGNGRLIDVEIDGDRPDLVNKIIIELTPGSSEISVQGYAPDLSFESSPVPALVENKNLVMRRWLFSGEISVEADLDGVELFQESDSE